MKVAVTSWILSLLVASSIASKSIDEFDPCLADGHTVIDDQRRRPVPNNVPNPDYLCDDRLIPAWYRFFLDGSSAIMPTSCVEINSCGTQAPVWLNLGDGKLPLYRGQEGFYLGCTTWMLPGRQEIDADCCLFRTSVRVRNCGDFYLYFLQPTQGCHMAYCVQPNDSKDNDFDMTTSPSSVASNPTTTLSHLQLKHRNSPRYNAPLKTKPVAISNSRIQRNCSTLLADNSVCVKQLKTYSEVKSISQKHLDDLIQDSSSDQDCPENYKAADGKHCFPVCKKHCGRNQVCSEPNICSCLPGYVGWHCRTAVCNPKCFNGGKCFRPNVCSCLPGFTGKLCDKVTCNFDCENGGRCISRDTCRCKAGFTGRRCEIALCSKDCHNGGFCVNRMGWSSCDCREGWVGPTCETPLCDLICRNGGMCSKPGMCLCPRGFFGSRCENGLCRPSCLNGGHCIRHNVCKCQNGWMGSQCQTPICEPRCLNGGKCYKPNKCDCTSGWRGTTCQKPICLHDCANGGSCFASNVCICPDGYEGSSCMKPVCHPKCQNGGICVSPGECLCRPHDSGHRCENLMFGGRFSARNKHLHQRYNIHTFGWAAQSRRRKTYFML